ncbi:MAG: zf-HC2 domain-containing protein [Peptococcaceae bacterium]|nr:zf-HC2 domain-containing protein [Peptococcaceae bacterium]
MDCRAYAPNISAYVDGELSQAEQLVVKHHLEQCSECRQLADDFLHLGENFRANINILPVPYYLTQSVLLSLKREHNKLTHLQMWFTGITIAVMVSPILILFSPLLTTLLHLSYVAFGAIWRMLPALLQIMPVSLLAVGAGTTIAIIVGIYFIRTLMRGISYDEVLS